MTEKELKRQLIDRLSRDFHIKKEWRGIHFAGGTKYIDLLIKPKVSTGWANKNLYMGIETKGNDQDDTCDISKYLRQVIDYSHTKWDHIGYMPIFMYPALTDINFPVAGRFIWQMQHLLNQFNVGEAKPYKDKGMSLVMASDHVIWSEKDGVQEGGRWKLQTKFGSK